MKELIKKIWKELATILARRAISLQIKVEGSTKSILFIIPWLTFGGAEKVNLEILEALKKDGWNIYIVNTKAARNEWENKFKEFSSNIIHIENFPQKLHTYIFLELIKTANIKVTFISNSFTGYLATPHISKFSNVVDLVHGEGGPSDNGGSALFSSSFDNYIKKRIVISERLKDLYINNYKIDPNKIEIIRNGIDVEETNKEVKRAVFPSTIENYMDQSKKIIWVGRLSKEKQPLKVVELAKQLPTFNFIIVGDGEMYDEIFNKSKGLNNIFLTGELSNNVVKKLISKSDLLIMTSQFEGLPVVILEAMALEKPVVATNVGALKEIVSDDINGYLVDSEKMLEIMPDLIQKAYENKEKLGKNAVKIVKGNFSKKEMQRKYLEVFNQLIK